MIQLSLSNPITRLGLPFQPGNYMILHGSCFSDEMGRRAENSGIATLSNPFGTIYHPLPMVKALKDALDERTDCRIFQRADLYFSWDASGSHYGMSEEEICNKIQLIRSDFRLKLAQSDFLVLTFGTAWLYTLNEDQLPVANCHQAPSESFKYSLSDSETMIDEWQQLIQRIQLAYPNIKIILSVSPVRYAKEGLVANNRSKEKLIELCHALTGLFNGVYYFPSYEIMIDELRDYRFYKKDLIHPNEQAIDYVWDRFVEGVFDEQTNRMIQNLQELNQLRTHQTRYPESKAAETFSETVRKRIEECKKLYPGVYIKN